MTTSHAYYHNVHLDIRFLQKVNVSNAKIIQFSTRIRRHAPSQPLAPTGKKSRLMELVQTVPENLYLLTTNLAVFLHVKKRKHQNTLEISLNALSVPGMKDHKTRMKDVALTHVKQEKSF
jgi:hypothetical protein